MSRVDVANAESLAPGQCRTVEVQGRRLALVNFEGRYFAMDDRCPHRGAPLGAGHVDGERLFCPLHGWEFKVTTGACATRPDLSVRSYPVAVERGRVWVDLGTVS
jgi:nitrite reductase/ring-hydroxylating ferredoxin subunit